MVDFEGHTIEIKTLVPGDNIRMFDRLMHQIIHIDKDPDTGNLYIVTKSYSPHKKSWYYDASELWLFLYNICLIYDLNKSERKKLYKLNGLEYEF